MKNNTTLFATVFIIGLLGGYFFFGGDAQDVPVETVIVSTSTELLANPTSTNTVNTTVKKPASAPVITSSNSGNYIRLGQKVTLQGVNITPQKVTYDSRCPRDVQCVQAGTVEVGVLLESGSATQNVIITLGKPFYFEGTMVTLSAVTPSKVSTKTIQESEYRFLFNVKI